MADAPVEYDPITGRAIRPFKPRWQAMPLDGAKPKRFVASGNHLVCAESVRAVAGCVQVNYSMLETLVLAKYERDGLVDPHGADGIEWHKPLPAPPLQGVAAEASKEILHEIAEATALAGGAPKPFLIHDEEQLSAEPNAKFDVAAFGPTLNAGKTLAYYAQLAKAHTAFTAMMKQGITLDEAHKLDTSPEAVEKRRKRFLAKMATFGSNTLTYEPKAIRSTLHWKKQSWVDQNCALAPVERTPLPKPEGFKPGDLCDLCGEPTRTRFTPPNRDFIAYAQAYPDPPPGGRGPRVVHLICLRATSSPNTRNLRRRCEAFIENALEENEDIVAAGDAAVAALATLSVPGLPRLAHRRRRRELELVYSDECGWGE